MPRYKADTFPKQMSVRRRIYEMVTTSSFTYHKPSWLLEGLTKLSETLSDQYGVHHLDYANVSYTEKINIRVAKGGKIKQFSGENMSQMTN